MSAWAKLPQQSHRFTLSAARAATHKAMSRPQRILASPLRQVRCQWCIRLFDRVKGSPDSTEIRFKMLGRRPSCEGSTFARICGPRRPVLTYPALVKDRVGSNSANQADFRLVWFISDSGPLLAEAGQAGSCLLPTFVILYRKTRQRGDIELLAIVVTWDTGISVEAPTGRCVNWSDSVVAPSQGSSWHGTAITHQTHDGRSLTLSQLRRWRLKDRSLPRRRPWGLRRDAQ
jgi:hypothetical protein